MIDLIACSLCLRVRAGSRWVAAEDVIRDIKSYDGDLPQLHGALCDECTDAIARRRADEPEALAA